MGVLWGVVAISKRSGGSGMRLCGATGLAQPRLIGRLLRSSGPSPACPPAKCLPVAGQQARDSVLGICARELLAAESCFSGSVAVVAAACTRPDGAVVYWTSARHIISVRGSCALIGEPGRYPKHKHQIQNKRTSISTGLRQPRTQHAWIGPRAFWVPGVWRFLAGVVGRRLASISIRIV